MRTKSGWVVLLAVLSLLLTALPAAADHKSRPSTKNMHAMGHSEHEATFFGVVAAEREISSDIAFWDDLAIHGNYNGFRIVDISAPGNPKLISHAECNGDQGDIVVWENIVVRSWNSPAPAGRLCDGQPVPVGFEGFHVFDISDPANPQLVGDLELSARPEADAFGCGSHTATGVPDLENNRLIIYNSTSIAPDCPFVGVIEVPLDNPAGIRLLRNEPLQEAHHSHDVGVLLGDANLMVSAGHTHANVFSIGEPRGGSLEDPEFLYTITEEGVGIGGSWHSAALSWDGKVIVLGWEPGGGAQARCQADSPDVDKSMFFYDADTGAKLGQWVLPRAQGADENCTIHNYNIVPLRSGRYVAVGGHYQAGTWVTDFTDPANPVAVAWSDPESLGTVVTPTGAVVNELGGAWSSYWYNNFIYESSITEGLNVFRASDRALAGAIRLSHLNPQTQEFTLP